MRTKLSGLFILFLFIFAGCGTVGNDLASAYNITKCEYKYNSISNMNLSGINVSRGISPLDIPKILSLLNGTASSIPLDFTLNLDVKNPNNTAAALNGLDYIISIDDIQFTTGKVNQQLNIASGNTQTLPLNIGVDLASLMRNNSKSAIENIAKNFLGLSNEKSNVKLQIKPTFMIGSRAVASPVYIPISFSFGGK